jgi:hypothetical protein
MKISSFAAPVPRLTDGLTRKQADRVLEARPVRRVPEVDPADIKAAWDYLFEARKRMGPGGAIGATRLAHLCKPGANVQAVFYRSQMLALVARMIQTQQLAPNEAGTLEMKVFKAAAKMPLEWMGERGREGLPFDVEKFLQQCA